MKESYCYFFKKFISPHTSTMALLISLSFASTLFSLATPLLARSLLDDVFIGGRTELIGYILWELPEYMWFRPYRLSSPAIKRENWI